MTFLIFQSGEGALSKHLLAIQYSVSVMNSPFTFEPWFHGDYPRQMTSLDSKSEVLTLLPTLSIFFHAIFLA